MCLAVPYEVLDVTDDERCLVRIGSGRATCFTGLVDALEPGDWVLVHAGFALARIDPADAAENLRLIDELLTAPAGGGGAEGVAAIAVGTGAGATGTEDDRER